MYVCRGLSMYVCVFVCILCMYVYVCMYGVCHDMQIPCTRYVVINRLYLTNLSFTGRTFKALLFLWLAYWTE